MNIAVREKQKYEQVWAIDRYREASPGLRAIEDAIRELGMQEGETVCDYGCGTGQASLMLIKHGLRVSALDITESALNEEARTCERLHFQEVDLCTCPDSIAYATDWAYCSDLMEHIPTPYIALVLEKIARLTSKGAFFNISNGDDCFGRMIKQELHPSKLPHEIWKELIEQFFVIHKVTDGDREHTKRYYVYSKERN